MKHKVKRFRVQFFKGRNSRKAAVALRFIFIALDELLEKTMGHGTGATMSLH